MFLNLRKLFALLAVVVLLAPAVGGLCASAAAGRCGATDHSCCKGPRLSQCHCGDAGSPVRESEAAQRGANITADNTPVAVVAAHDHVSPSPARTAWLSASPPVAPTSERLSRLATLLI